MTDRWAPAACAGLTATVAALVVDGGDGVGVDTLRYVAAARDLTAESELPPVLPLLLAPFTGSMFAMRIVMLAVSGALVGCIWWAAVKIGGWRSGAAASVLLLSSPGVVSGGAAVMSDRLGALLVVAALIALLHDRPWLAGMLVGLSAWVRLVHIMFAVVLPRRAWTSVAVVVGALACWQVLARGSLVGYSGSGSFFHPKHIMGGSSLEVPSPYTNIGYFPVRMFGLDPLAVGGWGAYLAPLVVFPGAIGLLRHWNRTAFFAAGIVVVNLVVYLPYYYQSARFILPGGCLLLVYAAAAVGGAPKEPPRSTPSDDDVASVPSQPG